MAIPPSSRVENQYMHTQRIQRETESERERRIADNSTNFILKGGGGKHLNINAPTNQGRPKEKKKKIK